MPHIYSRTSVYVHTRENYQLMITRNSSGDEIANVDFLYDEARPPY